jgi:membrane protease subunit (stomatin/prohibitin family)
MRVSELPRNIFNDINFGSLSGSIGTSDNFRYTGSRDTYTNASYNVNGMMRSVDFSKNGEVTAQAASASIDKYCADNGIINKMDAHDGMATMDSYVPKNDVGITVPGSKSTQKFQTTYMNALESEKHTIVLKLLGETEDNKPVLKPVTTKHKPKCVTCGKQNKATAKFCTECGTALEIFA